MVQNFIFSFFGELFKKIDKKCPKIVARHSWMRLVESSNTDVSGAFEVLQSGMKLFFRKPSCCVFAQKSIAIDKIDLNRPFFLS